MNIYQTDEKINARAEGVVLYRALSGLYSLPKTREYWTLCARQDTGPDTEINQLISLGLIDEHQFCGVDRDAELIAANRIDHPTARWYAGEWDEVIEQQLFYPGLVYLDTTGTAGCLQTAQLATGTMRMCPPETVLLINVMLHNPYSGRDEDPQTLLHNMMDRLTARELDCWGWDDLLSYPYGSGYTPMITIAMRRSR